MRTWLNKNFGFSKAEFNGLLVLIILIILIRAVPYIYHIFEKDTDDDSALLAEIQDLSIENEHQYTTNKKQYVRYSVGKKDIKLFYFDPNTVKLEGWQRLGLSVKQAQAIINYTAKGGKFYKAEDLKRMYTISPKIYEKIFPFIKIEPNSKEAFSPRKEFNSNPIVKKTAVIIEINSADSLQLQQVKGIGPAFARRIIIYRNKLGGFINKRQLMEVYGLDSSKFEEIKDQIAVDQNAITLININTADFETLKKFPYLTYKQINAIIQYRKQHGNYHSPTDLKKIAIIYQDLIDKITPYLSF